MVSMGEIVDEGSVHGNEMIEHILFLLDVIDDFQILRGTQELPTTKPSCDPTSIVNLHSNSYRVSTSMLLTSLAP